MIRYPVTLDELRALIEAEAPGWLARAAERTERFRRAGRYDEASGIWSEVKKVYMRLQHDKCGYCERQLASEDFGGAIEHDVEHYRPKNGVRRWPSEDVSYEFSTGEEFQEGYYLLAYHPFNYATACKKCNSPLKASYFPIAGPRGPQSDDPTALREEAPFLIYPLGELDDDPEEVLTFLGVSPVPRAEEGPRRDRARVMIDFFELDRREELWRERAETIVYVFVALRLLRTGGESDRDLATGVIEQLTSPVSRHTNCARAFRSLYEADPATAEAIAQQAQEYLKSQS